MRRRLVENILYYLSGFLVVSIFLVIAFILALGRLDEGVRRQAELGLDGGISRLEDLETRMRMLNNVITQDSSFSTLFYQGEGSASTIAALRSLDSLYRNLAIIAQAPSYIFTLFKDSPLYISSADSRPFRRFVNRTVAAHESHRLDALSLSAECYEFLLRFSCGRQSHNPAEHPQYQKYVLPVIQKIETDYNQPLTVPELSSLVYVTPQYLSRLFQRFLGCSVYTYLLNFRISMAKELLLNEPETEIQHIAHRVGFQDASHFISVFGASTGYTPLEFRRLHGFLVS